MEGLKRADIDMRLYKGESKTITKWIKELQISKTVVYRRLNKGLSIELAFTKGILK